MKNIQRYTKKGLTDVHLVYGIIKGNTRDAKQIHQGHFPEKYQMNQNIFAREH